MNDDYFVCRSYSYSGGTRNVSFFFSGYQIVQKIKFSQKPQHISINKHITDKKTL